jgi:hypothetical protein
MPDIIQFDSRDEARTLALELCQQAQREICFFGNRLDPVLFDNNEFVDALSDFARRSKHTQVKFVVHDTRQNTADGHLLIPLAQRLTSHIHIHKTPEKHQNLTQMFMLVDQNGYLYCPSHTRHRGRTSFDDALEVRRLRKTFDNLWDHSTPDSNIRRLGI